MLKLRIKSFGLAKAEEVSKKYAERHNRIERGLYTEEKQAYNADAVGAYNILRKYCITSGNDITLLIFGLSNPEMIKVAV